jgi:Ca-activated chloride channel family protein
MWGGNSKHNGLSEEVVPPEEEERPSEGTLELASDPRTGELAGFPLASTDVRARVHGVTTRVEVEQTFENPYDRAVEAVYLFPLPEDSAVDEMELRTGDRVVRARIRRREEARAEYRAAQSRGVLASLLEQERPNLFRQSIANIAPGARVSVVLRYTQVLPYEDGSYRFVFPMVAGPRYTPSGSDDAPAVAQGERRDRVGFEIEAELGGTLRDVRSPTHELAIDRTGPSSASIRLSGTAPDRDLDVRFEVAGDEPELALLSSAPQTDEPGFATLLVHPRLQVPEADVSAREIVFLLDTSSSMRGRPLELAKAAMKRALDGLRPSDSFRVLRFSDGVGELAPDALVASRENVARAHRFVDGLEALGATEMKRGIRAALDPPSDPARIRIVLLLTDGYIGNETEIFREVHERLGQSRLFAFGVGGAVNRYLLSRLCEHGRGDLQVVTLDESPQEAADRFAERIATPFVTDLSVDWGGLPVSDVYPRRVPDLFADRPLVVHGRYTSGGAGTVRIRGRIAGRAFEKTIPVTLSASDVDPSVASIWARARIADLTTAMTLAPSDALREEVVALGLRHHLLTEWTAFVAIDEAASEPTGGIPVTVNQATIAAASPAGGGFGGIALGSIGYGSGGTGYGWSGVGTAGAGSFAPRVFTVPSIRAASATVVGSLSSEVIRRIILRDLNRFRYCYERALARDPTLQGRVVLDLVIGADGLVDAATGRDETLGAADVASCIADAGRRLEFPAIDGGGTVEVHYPFVFSPDAQTESP